MAISTKKTKNPEELRQKNYHIETLQKQKESLQEKVNSLNNTDLEKKEAYVIKEDVEIYPPTGTPTVYEISIEVINKIPNGSGSFWGTVHSEIKSKFNAKGTILFNQLSSVRNEDSWENFLLLDNFGEYEVESIFLTKNYKVTINSLKNNLYPYINPKNLGSYCQLDSDCIYGRRFCWTSSHNTFSADLSGYGCERISMPEGYSEGDGEKYSHCKTIEDGDGNKFPNIEPINPVVACENNQCVTKSVDFVCAE